MRNRRNVQWKLQGLYGSKLIVVRKWSQKIAEICWLRLCVLYNYKIKQNIKQQRQRIAICDVWQKMFYTLMAFIPMAWQWLSKGRMLGNVKGAVWWICVLKNHLALSSSWNNVFLAHCLMFWSSSFLLKGSNLCFGVAATCVGGGNSCFG